MPKQPLLCLSLFDNNHKKLSSYESNTFSDVMEDIAADFDIAEPFFDSYGNQTYPIYVMQESGDVWVLRCRFSQNRYNSSGHYYCMMIYFLFDNSLCNYSRFFMS